MPSPHKSSLPSSFKSTRTIYDDLETREEVEEMYRTARLLSSMDPKGKQRNEVAYQKALTRLEAITEQGNLFTPAPSEPPISPAKKAPLAKPRVFAISATCDNFLFSAFAVSEQTPKGITLRLSGSSLDETLPRMYLRALLALLEHLKGENAAVHLPHALTTNGFKEGMYNWKLLGWRTKGGELKNRDLWEQLFAYHSAPLTFIKGGSPALDFATRKAAKIRLKLRKNHGL